MVKRGITPESLASLFPCLYHMAEDDTWNSIKRLGLLSTKALLDKFEINGSRRMEIEARHRSEFVFINHPKYGRIGIRDQKPMHERSLKQCLQGGMEVEEWY